MQTDKLKTFWGYFTDLINQSINGTRKSTNGNTFSESTFKSYRTLKHHLQRFEADKRKKIDFNDIDIEFHSDFVHFLESELLLANNNISKHSRTLKTVMREAQGNGFHNNNMIIQCIQNRIYELRGERVMLDRDVAALYETETKRLTEAVKRNIKRFPKDFMFQLTKVEFEGLKYQIETLEIKDTP